MTAFILNCRTGNPWCKKPQKWLPGGRGVGVESGGCRACWAEVPGNFPGRWKCFDSWQRMRITQVSAFGKTHWTVTLHLNCVSIIPQFFQVRGQIMACLYNCNVDDNPLCHTVTKAAFSAYQCVGIYKRQLANLTAFSSLVSMKLLVSILTLTTSLQTAKNSHHSSSSLAALEKMMT